MSKFTKQGMFHQVDKQAITDPVAHGLSMILYFQKLQDTFTDTVFQKVAKRWNTFSQKVKGNQLNGSLSYKLGTIMTCMLTPDIWATTLVCKNPDNTINEKAFLSCMKSTLSTAALEKASFHIDESYITQHPELVDYLKANVLNQGISVYVYRG